MKPLGLLAILLILAAPAHAATCGAGKAMAWDYPAAQLPAIDGFHIYLDGTIKASVLAQTFPCESLGLTAGSHEVWVTAYNAVAESDPSNSLPFVYVSAGPVAPTNLRRQ